MRVWRCWAEPRGDRWPALRKAGVTWCPHVSLHTTSHPLTLSQLQHRPPHVISVSYDCPLGPCSALALLWHLFYVTCHCFSSATRGQALPSRQEKGQKV